MTSERERWLGHFELFLHIKNRPNEELDLASGITTLKDLKIAGKPEVIQTDPRWIIQLADIAVYPQDDAAVLLFLGIDKERAEAVYGDITTLNLRTVAKLENEGGAVSAHLAISLTPNSKGGSSSAVLEEIEGLSRSRIIPYLRYLLNHYVQYVENQPNGDESNVDSTLTMNIILDEPIGKQLDDVRLLAVDLVRKPPSGDIDKSKEYYEKSRIISFRPTEASSGPKARRIIANILDSVAAKDYPEVRIRVEEDGESRQRTVGVDREKQDALLSAFQLRTLVKDIRPPLAEASNVIVKRLANAMVTELRRK